MLEVGGACFEGGLIFGVMECDVSIVDYSIFISSFALIKSFNSAYDQEHCRPSIQIC